MPATPPAPEKPSTPAWLIPALSLALSIGGSLATYSYKFGALETTTASIVRRVEALEADKAKRDADAAARLASFEQARAAKLAEMEVQIDRLKTMPTPR